MSLEVESVNNVTYNLPVTLQSSCYLQYSCYLPSTFYLQCTCYLQFTCYLPTTCNLQSTCYLPLTCYLPTTCYLQSTGYLPIYLLPYNLPVTYNIPLNPVLTQKKDWLLQLSSCSVIFLCFISSITFTLV